MEDFKVEAGTQLPRGEITTGSSIQERIATETQRHRKGEELGK
jgi:hypothetical protein